MAFDGALDMDTTPSEAPHSADLAETLFDATRAELSARAPPLSTYRLQLHPGFGFQAARAVIPYLARLGVGALYSSPLLKATPGSEHGYDVVDHGQLNPELGTPEDLDRLCEALAAHRMGHVLDTVPNHMGIERGNALWDDVLENGPASRYANTFDIDWRPVKAELEDKVLLPVLGDQYGIVLERGELVLEYAGSGFWVRYYDRRFPIGPRGYGLILGHGLEALERELGPDHESFLELRSILTAIEHLPRRTDTSAALVTERGREKEVIKRRIAALWRKSGSVAAFLERNVRELNGVPGDPRSFDLLDELLQHTCSYRLAHWRVAGEEINYRRFFDINGLAAIRVEDPEVFDEAHQLPLKLLREGKATGLRIDHPDGLFDPTAYFEHLQQRFFLERARALHADGGSAVPFEALSPWLTARWREEVARDPGSPLRKALYVVVEKIQGGRERIPDAWAVHGTTGYRFANAISGVFVDRSHERGFNALYARFIGHPVDYEALLYEKRRLVLSGSMASEVNGLARALNRISERNRRTRDFTLNSLRRALVELVACFPVYRTYVDHSPELDPRDVRYLEETIARAKRQDLGLNVSIFDFLGDILLRRYPEHLTQAEREERLRFAMKLQQLTGPVMAKGLEDTVFYLYNRLSSLNEVGGEPERFGTTLSTFHARNQDRAVRWPSAMLSSSTHDTKRSEDVRARLSVLSEVPALFRRAIQEWARLNARHKTEVGGKPAPDANAEYLFYQTVVGAWPMGSPPPDELDAFRVRMRAYLLKATKEAKVETSWVNPNPAYDAAVARFVDQALDPVAGRAFLKSAEAFKRRIERAGQLNALGQAVLKLTSPGTADVYQGCELWDLSLVDPDNRRPVDFGLRARLLEGLDAALVQDRPGLCRELLQHPDDGRVKLFVHAELLRYRRANEALFRTARYEPLQTQGPEAERLIAFCRVAGLREGGVRELVVAVPRLVFAFVDQGLPLAEAFTGTNLVLPGAGRGTTLRSLFTGREVPVEAGPAGGTVPAAALFEDFPVAVLERET
jgi:(1->4)-alpha-D-glucan 1-alpha-D-glucosylmutase